MDYCTQYNEMVSVLRDAWRVLRHVGKIAHSTSETKDLSLTLSLNKSIHVLYLGNKLQHVQLS